MNPTQIGYDHTHYRIYDEHGELMRLVKTKHEAEHLIKTYTDWSYQFVRGTKPDFANLGEAPF